MPGPNRSRIVTLEEARESQRPWLTIEETAAIGDMSWTTARNAINSGQIPSIRLGARTVVPREPFLQLLQGAA